MWEAFVLVVDDDEEFLATVGARLTNRGFMVHTAKDGVEALEKIAENIYDTVVLDLQMPRMDGLATLQKALAKKPNLQVVLLTGHADIARGVEAMRLGAVDFLEKPADLDLLAEKIRAGKEFREEIDGQKHEEAVMEALKKYGW